AVRVSGLILFGAHRSLRAREFLDLGQQLLDRRIEANDGNRLAVLELGHPLMMSVEYMPILGYQNGAIGAGEFLGLLYLGLREFLLRRLQGVRRHFILLMRDTTRIEEVRHCPTML